jgi:hypothetical protein
MLLGRVGAISCCDTKRQRKEKSIYYTFALQRQLALLKSEPISDEVPFPDP